jgi:CheY-like chemotaxis protein
MEGQIVPRAPRGGSLKQDGFLESLHGKRIGLVDCTAIEAVVASALKQAQASFAILQANSVDPGAPELNRFDGLMLGVGVGEAPSESDWLRPDILKRHIRPLLLAGPPDEIYRQETLQSLADDVIFSPFSESELLFRLYRITSGECAYRETTLRSGKPIVLVADDDCNITSYLEAVFTNLNVEAHFVADGRSALAAARQLLPDLLLLDIGLPIMTGLEVLRRLRYDPGTRDIATILLTASSDPSNGQQAANLGVSDYILKPFGHIDLVRKLKALLPIQSRRRQA